MFKFTKYGKAASAKSFSNNAFNEKPEVVLTSYKVTPSTSKVCFLQPKNFHDTLLYAVITK